MKSVKRLEKSAELATWSILFEEFVNKSKKKKFRTTYLIRCNQQINKEYPYANDSNIYLHLYQQHYESIEDKMTIAHLVDSDLEFRCSWCRYISSSTCHQFILHILIFIASHFFTFHNAFNIGSSKMPCNQKDETLNKIALTLRSRTYND